MLVISRKEEEAVIVGSESILVKVLEINNNQVRLGFNAPMDCLILRQELVPHILKPDSHQ